MQFMILGMHRSGTSLLSRLLNLMGANVGSPEGLGRPAADNPKGFWERWEVAHLNNRILAAAGGAWDEIFELQMDRLPEPDRKRAATEIAEIVFRLDAQRPWVLKDPRLSLTGRCWIPHLECPVFLLAVREPLHVAQSLAQRNALPLDVGVALWDRYNASALELLAEPTAPAILVDYGLLVARPYENVENLHACLKVHGATGLRLPSRREVESFVSTTLDRSSLRSSADGEPAAWQAARGRYLALQRSHLESPGLRPWDPDAFTLTALRAWHERSLAEHGSREALEAARRRDPAATGPASATELLNEGLGRIERRVADLGSRVLDDAGRRADLARQGQLIEEIRNSLASRTESDGETERRLAAMERVVAVTCAQVGESLRVLRDGMCSIEQARHDLEERLAGRLEARHRVELERLVKAARDEVSALVSAQSEVSAARLDQVLRWMDELGRLHGAVFSSFRWRVGNVMVRALEMILLRPRTRTAADDISTIDMQFRQWLDAPSRAPQASPDDSAASIAAERGRPRDNGARILHFAGRFASAFARGVVAASKMCVHALISALPVGAQRKQRLRNRIFELQESILLRTPSTAMLEDAQALARDRYSALTERPESREPPLIDLSLVLYNNERHVPGFVQGLAELDYPLERIRLLVTDHSPDGGSASALESALGALRDELSACSIVRRPNAGFGAGHNSNLARASADLFMVCNVDGMLDRPALRRVAEAIHASSDEVAAWELRQIPFEHPKYYDPVTLEASWVSGACVVFRTSALRDCNGFEPRIFMYGEDVDLSYRLRAKGWRLRYVPSAVMRHDSYAEAEEFKPLQFLGSTLANMYLRLRFGRGPDLAAVPAMWLGLAPIAARQGQLLGYLRQTGRLVWNAPYFLASRPGGALRVPFAGWDYGMRRDGAFVTVEPVRSEQPPLVSIITRTYAGRGALLRQALRSIANQTYRNVEVLVPEDGSGEARAVCEEVASSTGLRILHLPLPKGGRCASGNAALASAKGELIGFLDDDDLFFADHVELLVATLLRFPSLGAAYGLSWESSVKVGEDGLTRETMHRTASCQRQSFSRKALAHHNLMPIQAVLFRRALYDELGGFDGQLEILEDWDLWRRYSHENDFLLVAKTTSVYHVPADRSIQAERQAQLDQYYQVAQARFEHFVRSRPSQRAFHAAGDASAAGASQGNVA